MTSEYPEDAWSRLGSLLAYRRGRLDPEYLNRTRFAEAAGLNVKLVADIERNARQNYGPATLSAIERAYRWAPGSISRVLAGGDPEPLHEVHDTAPVAAADPLAVRAYNSLVKQYRDNACREVASIQGRIASIAADLDGQSVVLPLGAAKTMARDVADLIDALSALAVLADVEFLTTDPDAEES